MLSQVWEPLASIHPLPHSQVIFNLQLAAVWSLLQLLSSPLYVDIPQVPLTHMTQN